ncbi:MAG TPA: hypothetical protein VLJ42_09955 [Solirubrobacteraceae bacterium]|nr:hypothetical protein [Solirubrobacteraceae bacterium]
MSARQISLSLGLLVALALPAVSLGAGGSPELNAARTVPPRAFSAKTTTLHESGHLRLTSRHGFTLNERGAASGTISGTIYVHLTITSTSRVSADVSIRRSNGSISGSGTASYHRGATFATFSGSLSISSGSGRYRHAHGSGLSFSGTIRRSDYAISVQVSGKLYS